MMGRVSNPMRHIDPLGTIAIPLAMYFLTGGAFLFGYAKPVPVSFGNLRIRAGRLWVSLVAGLQLRAALLGIVLTLVLPAVGVDEPFFTRMAFAGVSANLVLGVLNLFPLPPLAAAHPGGAAADEAIDRAVAHRAVPDFIIVLVLVATGVLTNFWLRRSSTSAMPS